MQDRLTQDFEQFIDLSDVPANAAEVDRKNHFLTRALAAFVVRQFLDCSPEEAARAVIDGRDDNGIDAIAIDENESRLWLIQTKWSRQGTASFELGSALKLVQGLRLLLNTEYSRFNARFRRLAGKIDAVLSDSHVKITLVPVVMGDGRLADEVRRALQDEAEALNSYGDEMLDIRVLGLKDVHRAVRAEFSEPRIELSAVLDSCGWVVEPYKAFYGVISAEQIAEWHNSYGDRLFDQNIRKSLGLTKVNRSLIDTLTSRPNDFWYFNNGITVLCAALNRTARYSATSGGPREFRLEGASVVNGAQTVYAITEALRRAPDVARAARVWIRLISLEDCPEGFAGEITEATNTQNRVEKRDLAALDAVQVRLRDEFPWAVQKTYVIKGGEADPEPSSGCANTEAAEALACAHRNPELAVQAKIGGDLLWETGHGGTYSMIFYKKITPHRVWRTVLLRREVERYLDETNDQREGRAAAVAREGRFLLTHIVYQSLSHDRIDDPGTTWVTETLSQVRQVAERALQWLIYEVDAVYGVNSYVVSVFKNPEKCRTLAGKVQASLESGLIPELPSEYVAKGDSAGKRARAVSVLVDAGVIKEGTPLEFRPVTREEIHAMTRWIADDPRRGRATWVNNKTKPLIWEADGQRYAPSRLVMHMREQVLGKKTAVQGTKYWFVRGAGSLVELAAAVRNDEES